MHCILIVLYINALEKIVYFKNKDNRTDKEVLLGLFFFKPLKYMDISYHGKQLCHFYIFATFLNSGQF